MENDNQKQLESFKFKEIKDKITEAYQKFTGYQDPEISSIEPKENWYSEGAFTPITEYHITFKHKNGHEILRFEPKSNYPVSNIYGKPSQVFKNNIGLLEDLVKLVKMYDIHKNYDIQKSNLPINSTQLEREIEKPNNCYL